MDFFHNIIEIVLPVIISVLEVMGILIVAQSAVFAFWEYLQNTFFHKQFDLKYRFATGLATALEFKMAAEILKTVIIKEMSELLVLGAVIILRAILSLLIHFEMKSSGD